MQNIFIKNKYAQWYFNIIENARFRILPENIYTEKHHILPKSLGGDNSDENLVRLTAKEHFIVHRLLVKMTEGEHKRKMMFALSSFMGNNRYHKRILSGLQYQKLKENASYIFSMPKSEETRERMRKSALNKKIRKETREKISESKKGVPNPWPEERYERHKKFIDEYWTEEKRKEYKKYGGRNKKPITDGEIEYESVAEWCRQTGFSKVTAFRRINKGKLLYV